MSTGRPKTTRRSGGRTPVRPPLRGGRSKTPWIAAGVVVLVVIGLFVIYQATSTSAGSAGNDRYQVGRPGVGEQAPDFLLPNVTAPPTAGGAPATTRLSDYRGKTVLLYFHEGLGCQPCWDQIRDLQKNPAALSSLGVNQLLTITSGPPDLIAQKMSDDKLTAVALADTGLQVSSQYHANGYGMMGSSRDGHSFILVGPDGVIQWRADYGGAPKFTMYVPVDQLAADLRAGRKTS